MSHASDRAVGDRITGARDYQEDSFAVISFDGGGEDEWLLLLADGMGGHVGGARASELVVAAFAAHFRQAADEVAACLRASLNAANAAIAEGVAQDLSYAGMGCTLLACHIKANKLHWLSVGDSPLWLLRGSVVTRLNADHSMRPILEGLVELGRMSAAEVETDHRINQLRSVVMGEEIRMVDENESLSLQVGDQIILASDGVETLTVDEIGGVCDGQSTAANAVSALLSAIAERQRPGQDNATAIVYRHGVE